MTGGGDYQKRDVEYELFVSGFVEIPFSIKCNVSISDCLSYLARSADSDLICHFGSLLLKIKEK
jgi:hypothetical protein